MDIVERLKEHLRFNGKDQLSRDAKDEIERLRKTNITQTRWLYEIQQENKLFKDKVRQWLDIDKPAAMEGE